MTGIFNYNDRRIHFKDVGRGEVILLIHGYLETSEIWDSFAGKLSAKYRVISPDLPGHGHSDIFGEVHSMEFIASIINELLNYLKIEKMFLLGHSLGGYVVLAFTELFPERLTGYSLFHSHPFADTPEILLKRENEINMVNAGRKDDFYPGSITKMYATKYLNKFSKSLERSMSIASSVRSEGIVTILRGMMIRPSRLHILEEGNVPFLWILGELDNYINCKEMQNKVNLPANAEAVILKDSGHMGFIEEEDRSFEAVDLFLGRILRT